MHTGISTSSADRGQDRTEQDSRAIDDGGAALRRVPRRAHGAGLNADARNDRAGEAQPRSPLSTPHHPATLPPFRPSTPHTRPISPAHTFVSTQGHVSSSKDPPQMQLRCLPGPPRLTLCFEHRDATSGAYISQSNRRRVNSNLGSNFEQGDGE